MITIGNAHDVEMEAVCPEGRANQLLVARIVFELKNADGCTRHYVPQ
jgi:hypothetical protein